LSVRVAEKEALPVSRPKPARAAVESAVRTLIQWTGEDPEREGLRDTPNRVSRAFEEFYAGYARDPAAFPWQCVEVSSFRDGMVVLRDVRLDSHCEHHMVPIIGTVHLGYLPLDRVAAAADLAGLIEAFGRRLQIQERLTAQIAQTIQSVLQPRGVAVIVRAAHQCMTTRGVRRPGATTVTSRMLGAFRTDAALRGEFLSLIGSAAPDRSPGG